jgi:hypothetical protein
MWNLRKKQWKILLDRDRIELMICTEDWRNKSEVNLYLDKLLREIAPEYIYFLKNKVVPETKKFRIVYCCNMEYFIKKMSRVRFWAIIELARHPNVAMFFIGNGWANFIQTKSIDRQISCFQPNFLIWYKPMEYYFKNINIPTCIRYNEMWDEKWTCKEINDSMSNLIICHHKNDWEKYVELYKNKINHNFIYLPHHANPEIFYNQYLEKDIDILIAGVIKERNYPLKYRLSELVKKYLGTYRIHILQHPGYNIDDAYSDKIQKEFAYYINRSKLVIACTSAYNYRLGKYVEIPMCGGVIVGDIPYEEQDDFRKFVVEVNMNMSDDEILDKIKMVLENRELQLKYSLIGEAWSQKYTTKKYVDELYNQMVSYKKHPKIYIISDEIRDNHWEFKNEKWICDELKKEFAEYFGGEIVVMNIHTADIIWYLAPWNYGHTPVGLTRDEWLEMLKKKKVVFTMHHIDEEKYKNGELDKTFEFMLNYGTKWHAICGKTYDFLKNMAVAKDITIPIVKEYLWVDSEIFFEIQDKNSLREKWGLSGYVVGSFQKDTEGRTNEPKMSKGPDIFVNIVEDIHRNHPDLLVVLSGIRRTYIISELEKRGIQYKYFEMIGLSELNELYNCLDLYVVSSRVEGGPRAIVEAGITKTPIISTDVGIASDLMSRESIYDVEFWGSYKNVLPCVEELYMRVSELEKKKQIWKIKNMLII